MDAVSVTAALAAGFAGLFLGVRANMLKPDMSAWPESPRCVRWASFGLSVFCEAYAATIVLGGHRASDVEVMFCLALATYAFFLWLNLQRQVKGA